MSFFGFMKSDIKLHYFDARGAASRGRDEFRAIVIFGRRGVAEDIRYMLAMAKVPYEDKRFSFSFGVPGDFSTIKRPERVGRVPSLRGGSASVVPWLELCVWGILAGTPRTALGSQPCGRGRGSESRNSGQHAWNATRAAGSTRPRRPASSTRGSARCPSSRWTA